MRIIALSGGLGNQMFQYAFFLTLKKRYRYVFFSTRKIHKRKEHNGYELNRLFGVQSFFSEILLNIPMLGWILYYVLFPQKYKEGKCYFFSGNSDVFDAKYSKTRYTGYWQSEKFFKDAEEDVRNIFKFNKEKLNKQTRDFLDVIKRTPHSVSLHVRRGDYVSPLGEDGPPSIFGNVCTDYYYTEARRRILERFPHAVFFIFSDDTNWC
ncbi:MAG: alpha-1,2-fucosyltransferase, partial [Bacteroidaceae bacterium]